MSSATPRIRVRLTRDGMALAVFLAALMLVGWLASNNLVVLVASTLVAGWVLGTVWARSNLAGVSVRRILPSDVHARRPARVGYALSVSSGRRMRFGIRLDDFGRAASPAFCDVLEPSGETVVHTTRSFPTRGRLVVGGLRLRSTFPFGLLETRVELPVSDEIWVYPEPRAHGPVLDGMQDGSIAPTGIPEDVRDLRPYRPGDRLRDLHWPTSARVGRPMVVVRDRTAASSVWVTVRESPEVDREEAIRRACGAILDASARGRPVGLRADGRAWMPRAGSRWRRELLTVLASLPRQPPSRRDGGARVDPR